MTQIEARKANMGLVVAASAAGTVFEWYDFFIFGSLAAIIAKHFFSAVNPSQAYLLALLTFAAGFAARPFGAVVFGRIGDVVGRKRAFLVTITAMGLATFAVALLPDYASIGVAAPYALVIIRVLQGFAIGGEYGGAAIYVAEHSSARNRGFSTGWIQAAAGMGLVLALVVIIVTRERMGEDAFADWGWRIPFGLSVVLLGISLWIRLSLEESPLFRKMQEEGRTSKAPLTETFTQPKNLKLMLIALFGLLMGQGVVWYTAQFYTQFFLERVLKVEPSQINLLILVVTLVGMPLYMLFAWLSDIIGRKPVMLAGLFLAAVGFIPGFQMLTAAADPMLANAAAHAPVTVTADADTCSLQFDLVGKAKFVSSCDIAKSALTAGGIPYTNAAGPAGAHAVIHVGRANVIAPNGNGLDAKGLDAARKTFEAQLKSALAASGYPTSATVNVQDVRSAVLILLYFIVASALLYAPQAATLVELFPTRIRYTALSVPYHIGVGWFGGFLPATAFAIVAATGNIYAGLWYPVIVAGIGFFVTLFFVPETRGRAID
ncbi:MAG TPA: MFS transporter [Rhizomicrobium sp.]|jgi:nitrate/nitrite transporter NarK|nr:MFS transporter [Rhizomicrobium sp.]